MIYLDYAAHAPADPAVLERFCDMERRFPANPNSVRGWQSRPRGNGACHRADCVADRRVPSRGHFSPPGATEANNLAIKGVSHRPRGISASISSPHRSSIPRSAAA